VNVDECSIVMHVSHPLSISAPNLSRVIYGYTLFPGMLETPIPYSLLPIYTSVNRHCITLSSIIPHIIHNLDRIQRHDTSRAGT
jgi:hypothetical protein